MNGSIALGWLLATIIFALVGNAWLTVVFFVGAFIFGILAQMSSIDAMKADILDTLTKGETDES